MAKKNNQHADPPPLPDVATDDSVHVEPPPVLQDSAEVSHSRHDEQQLVEPAAETVADPVDAFLSRAGAVLALERGMNARSRVKLAAIADELGLSDDEFATAMEKLQGGGKQEQKLSREELRELRRRKRAFHNQVGEALMALPSGVLISSSEQQLIADAVQQHGLTEEEAAADIRHLAKQLRIRRITVEEAQRHIAELTDYALKPAGVLRDDVRQRIYAEGGRWGLTPEQVEPILRKRLSHVRMGERKEQMRMVGLISASAAVLVGVLGMIAWMAFSRALPDAGPDTHVATGDDDGGIADHGTPPVIDETPDLSHIRTSGAPHRLSVPDWWSDDLSSYIANIRLRLPSLEGDVYQLRSPNADDRTQAYDNLLDALERGDLSDDDQAILSGLFAAAYAIDPSDACADHLRERLMLIAAISGKSLPKDMAAYASTVWVARTAVWALFEEEPAEDRRTAMLDAIERTFESSLDRELPPLKLQREIMTAAGVYLYKSLTRHANENVEIAVDLHKELLGRIDPFLDLSTSDRLGANYLQQVLPTLGERWQIYDNLIRRCALSEDPLNVLLMVELFERAENAELQSALGAYLVLRTGLSRATPRTAEELAAAVREELGVSSAARPFNSAERYTQWREAVDEQLADDPLDIDNTDDLLQDIVESTRLSTLGVALAQGELGEAEFAAIWEEKSPNLKSSRRVSTAPAVRAPRVNATQLKSMGKNIDALRGYSRLDKSRRLSYLRLVANYAGTVTDVQPEQGQAIAMYLAAPKAVDEHERLMLEADNLLRWRMVRLGLADQLAESRLRTEHMAQLLEKALHREVDLEKDGWRDRLRDELLANIARELSTEDSLSGESTSAADRAAEILTELYQTQAKLRGVGAAAYNAATSPSEVLLLLIQQARGEISGASLAPEDRQRVGDLPHEIIAIDYVAGNELARTVAFQRLWLELLRIERAAKKSPHAAHISDVRRQLEQEDAKSEHVLQQLAAGERALLQHWQIHNQP